MSKERVISYDRPRKWLGGWYVHYRYYEKNGDQWYSDKKKYWKSFKTKTSALQWIGKGVKNERR